MDEQRPASPVEAPSDMRYIGSGSNPKGTFFVFVMRDGDHNDQWWVFTVLDEKVVAIE